MFIKNGLVITLDPERRVISDGAVAIQGNRIVAVGKTGVLEKTYGSDEAIDASRKIVMPGLVNAHNHIYQLIGRGLRADGRLQRWRAKSRIHWNIDYWCCKERSGEVVQGKQECECGAADNRW